MTDGTDRPPETSPAQPPAEGQKPKPPSRWRAFVSLLWSTGIFHPEEWPIRRMLGTAIGLCAALFLLAVARQGIAHVREEQVGVLVNNLTGNLELRDRVGYHIFCPYLAKFYVLDKTIQRLDLTFAQKPGAMAQDVKLKTVDGSNVSLDVVIDFKLIPEKAVEILRRSGDDLKFVATWVEPFARHTCFASFSQLTTEEMYDAAKRNERAQAALKDLNDQLGPHGVNVVAVIPGEFRFYKEYEEVIQQKKLADQQVEEQQAQARAAQQDQERQIIEATKKSEAKLVGFDGECANRIIQAQAEADKTRREADGRYGATVLNADAEFFSMGKQAEGTRATLLAEAEGTQKKSQAMVGDGGVAMVGMEYAKRLKSIRFAASPIAREPTVQQFAVQPGEAAAVGAQPAPAPAAKPAPPAPRPQPQEEGQSQ
ncbi:MAG: SPFH domain-containing protein [Candidatus Sumerlaeota bacterium]|nr:SPFH domain-containing protein [Candidatus Sumerlaeota bacterium]